jgi:hypothetical protein
MDVDNGGQAVETGSADASQPAELSLRDELVRNLAELKGDATDDAPVTTPEATATGKPEGDQPTDAGKQPTSTENPAPTAPEPKTKAPQSWSAADRAHWDKIPAEVQAVIARREEEAHRGITTMGQDASFGKRINEIVTPYLPIIRAEGGTPEGAVRDLLQTVYVLRTANPEQKTALFRQIATQYGVDLSAAAQAAPQVNPEVQALRQELAQVKGYLHNGEQQQHQQVQEQAQQLIDAFAADPKNEFYEQVKPFMGQLLVSGQASTIQDAYDRACWAAPDVRSTLMQRQQAEAEAKRATEAKAKVDAKRRAGGSISGSPGSPVPTATTANPNLDLRGELRAAYRAATSS